MGRGTRRTAPRNEGTCNISLAMDGSLSLSSSFPATWFSYFSFGKPMSLLFLRRHFEVILFSLPNHCPGFHPRVSFALDRPGIGQSSIYMHVEGEHHEGKRRRSNGSWARVHLDRIFNARLLLFVHLALLWAICREAFAQGCLRCG